MATKATAARLTTTATSVYTSTNTTSQILAATATNQTSSNETIQAYIIVSGGAISDDGAQIYKPEQVPANDEVGLDKLVGHVLNDGEELYLSAGANSAIDVRISFATGV